MERTYICIDLKSYYASVECVHRGLDPLKANLLVADESRSDQTICLAVSPSLKAKGVPGRPRLFEAKQIIREFEARNHTKVDYIIAVPHMAEYERISAQIYGIYLRYVAPEDIHVYSIDECFIDCTCYLHAYRKEAEKLNTNPAHVMAMTMIRDVLRTTGITATVGIGTNRLLYRRLGVCANDVKEDSGVFQLNMFIDYEALERDRKLQGAMLEVRRKFGSNALFKGMNLMECATTLERNQQIGGHKA